MKTLYLVRHAKSSWEFDLDDHKRPLNDRGLRDAPLMAQHIASKMPKPDLIMSSDALRAKTTALFFAQAYEISSDEIVLEPRMYDFQGQNLLHVIRTCPDIVDTLMIFGHNNAMTNIVNSYGDSIVDNVPTCGFTAIEFNSHHWKELALGNTIYSCTPKQLK